MLAQSIARYASASCSVMASKQGYHLASMIQNHDCGIYMLHSASESHLHRNPDAVSLSP